MSLQEYGSISSSAYVNLVTPELNHGSDNVYNFTPTFVFDKSVIQTVNKAKLQDSYKYYACFSTKSTQATDALSAFLTYKYMSLAKQLYQMCTTPLSLYINTSTGELYLHTRPFSSSQEFQVGSSIAHVDQDLYTRSPEFLMRPATSPGFTLSTLASSYNGNVIGPKTLHVFKAMGWRIAPDNATAYSSATSSPRKESYDCDSLLKISQGSSIPIRLKWHVLVLLIASCTYVT
jgi:hypothetical protein